MTRSVTSLGLPPLGEQGLALAFSAQERAVFVDAYAETIFFVCPRQHEGIAANNRRDIGGIPTPIGIDEEILPLLQPQQSHRHELVGLGILNKDDRVVARRP